MTESGLLKPGLEQGKLTLLKLATFKPGTPLFFRDYNDAIR